MDQIKEEKVTLYSKIKESALLCFWKIYRILKYENVYFFDTNIIVSNSQFDKRLTKLFTLNKKYFVDSHIRDEINTLKTTDGFRTVFKYDLKTVNFDDLRIVNPEICPIYYNFISAMHNPAIVWGQNFLSEGLISELMQGNWSSNDKKKEYEKLNIRILGELQKQVEIQRKKYGQHKLFNFINSVNFKSLKKKREAVKKNDPHYLNDLRAMSSALIYSLIYRKNVTFVTADTDHVSLMSNLIETLTQQMTFRTFILKRLSEDHKRRLIKGDRAIFKFNTFDFVKSREGLEGDMQEGSWRKSSFCFKIKFWDTTKQKYRSFNLPFNELGREMFLSATGQLACPYAKNNDLGSWLAFLYYWPPQPPDDISTLKVEVYAKSIINRENEAIDNAHHNSTCKYVLQDKSNDLVSFSQFVTPKTSTE
jgi:hypothetical protein